MESGEGMTAMNDSNFDAILSHAGWLRELARSLVHDPATADDAVQETYLAALRSPPKTNRPLRPWLGSVLRNTLRQRHRGETRRRARETPEGSVPSSMTSVDIVERAEMQKVLAEEIVALREPYKSAIVLRYLAEKSSAEIAEQLDTTESTIRSRLDRGRQQLRERLDRRYGDRSTWCTLLLPFAGPRVAPPIGATSGPVTLQLAATAAALVVASAAWVAFQVTSHQDAAPSTVRLDPLGDPAPSHATAAPEREVGERVPAVVADRTTPILSTMVTGQVLFDDATPAVGSSVEFLGVPPDGVPLSGSTLTEADGRFAIFLSREPPSRPDAWTERYPFPVRNKLVVRSDAHAPSIRIPAFDELDRLVEGSTIELGVVHVETGIRVQGRVVSPAEEPIEGARVYLVTPSMALIPDERSGFDIPPSYVWEAGRSAADGTFCLREPAPTRASVGRTGLALFVRSDEGIAFGESNLLRGKTEHRVTLVVTGRALSVNVRDALGNPIQGALARFVPRGVTPEVMLPGLPAVRTDDRGWTSLASSGDGRIVVEAVGFEPKNVMVFANDATDVAVLLQPRRTVAISGFVRFGNAPVEGATIRVQASPIQTRSDANGFYELREVAIGSRLAIETRSPGFASRCDPVAVPDSDVIRRDVQLEAGRPTRIHVADENGAAVPGLTLILARQISLFGTDHGDGWHEFSDTSAGAWSLRFSGEIDATRKWIFPPDLRVNGGESVAVTIFGLHPARCELVIRTVDRLGRPVDPIGVSVRGRPMSVTGNLLEFEIAFTSAFREAGQVRARIPAGTWTFDVEVERMDPRESMERSFEVTIPMGEPVLDRTEPFDF